MSEHQEPKQEPQAETEAVETPQAEAAETGAAPAAASNEAVDSLLDNLQPEIEALVAERDELKDRLLRAFADVENTRKRAERDRREAAMYGGQKLAADLLPVYDNLNRALDSVDDAQREIAAGLIEGIEITRREILSVFEKHGIKPVSPEVGDKFDPQLHQAMFEAPVPDVPAGGIIQVMVEGFTIGDRLMRPAQVGVSSTPAN